MAISKEFPLISHPRTRELEVVIQVIEQGPKAHMPLTWFMEAPVPAVAKGRKETEKSNTLVEDTSEASSDRLRNISEILGASAAPVPNVLGHGYAGNLAAFSNMHQFGATSGSMFAPPRRNSRDLFTFDSTASNMVTPMMQRPDAAFLHSNLDIDEVTAARKQAGKLVDAAMMALMAARQRASDAITTFETLQKKELALRLNEEDKIMAAYRANNNACNGEVGDAPAGQAAADQVLAMQNHLRSLASTMPSGSLHDEAIRRGSGLDA